MVWARRVTAGAWQWLSHRLTVHGGDLSKMVRLNSQVKHLMSTHFITGYSSLSLKNDIEPFPVTLLWRKSITPT